MFEDFNVFEFFCIFFEKRLYFLKNKCYNIQAIQQWDIAKLVRQWILTPSLRRFESYYPSQNDKNPSKY